MKTAEMDSFRARHRRAEARRRLKPHPRWFSTLPHNFRSVFALLAFVLPTLLNAQAHQAGVDPRIELISIIFRLAGANEYRQGRVPAYLDAVDDYFAPHTQHEVVQLVQRLRTDDGVSYDAVMNLAVRVKDVETLAERLPFDDPRTKLDGRWKGAKSRAFLAAARRFVTDTKFQSFLESQKALYEVTNSRLREFTSQQADIAWFDRFFGAKPRARFYIVPGLVNGGSSYGANLVAEDGVEELYAIPGVGQIDAAGQPRFSGDWLNTLVHEFVHSYANPLVDKHEAKLAKAGRVLHEPVREIMRQQAYTGWETVLKEALVRAAVVRYVGDHRGVEAARAAAAGQHDRGFVWTWEFASLFDTYEKKRAAYPTLDAFMPQVVRFFDDVAPRVPAMLKRFDESRPKVISMSVKDGAQDVDPALSELVFEFDRPMVRDRYSVFRKDPATYPKVNSAGFDESGRKFILAVKLEPAHNYELTLGSGFFAADGVPIKPAPLRFRTR